MRQTARRLYLSQSALSQQLRTLEREWGIVLFRRGPRGVTLTDEGERLLPSARRLIGCAEALSREVRATGAGQRASLRIGYADETSAVLRRQWERLVRWFPEDTLDPLDAGTCEGVMTGLRSGEYDLGVVVGETVDRPFASRSAGTVAYQVAVPVEHWMATVDEVEPGALAEEPRLLAPASWAVAPPAALGRVAAHAQPYRRRTDALFRVEVAQAVAIVAEGRAPRDGVVVRPLAGELGAGVEAAFAWDPETTRVHDGLSTRKPAGQLVEM